MLFDHSFAPSMPPADLLQHIGQLRGEQLPPVPRQHVTSKVILKQFGDPDRNGGQRLCAVSLERKRSRYLGPAACGKIKDFVPVASGSIEQRWQAVETDFNDALRYVRLGSLFQEPRYVSVIKDAIALHYVRSVHLLLIHYDTLRKVWSGLRSAAVEHQPYLLGEHFRAMKGFHAGGSWALEWAFDDLAATNLENFVEGWGFRSRIENMYERVRGAVAGVKLQILEARSELVISDAPAVAANADRSRIGPPSGLGLEFAAEVVMPLATQYAARLSTDPEGYVAMSAAQSDELNRLQIANAYRHVYCRPTGGNEAFILSNVDRWQHPLSIDDARQAVLGLRR